MSDEQQMNFGRPENDYVLGFMFSASLRYVGLIQKAKPEWQAGKWNGVGGRVEALDFTYLDAMVREFYEETGVQTRNRDWFPIAIGAFPSGRVFIYAAQSEKVFDIKQTTAEKPDVFCVREIKYSDVDMIPNLRWFIPLCQTILSIPLEYRPVESIKMML